MLSPSRTHPHARRHCRRSLLVMVGHAGVRGGGAGKGRGSAGSRGQGCKRERVAVCLSVRVCFRERFSILLPSPPVLPLFVSCWKKEETEPFRHELLLLFFSKAAGFYQRGKKRMERSGKKSTLSQRVRQKEVRLD